MISLFVRKRQLAIAIAIAVCINGISCSGSDNSVAVVSSHKTTKEQPGASQQDAQIVSQRKIADAATIMARTQVPVLCYHHIKYPQANWGEMSKTYSVSPDQFAEQMKALHDSGYHTVLPDQLYNYLAFGDPLPEKPVMLTFDDTDEEQFTVGAKEMEKYGFKGVFFIMTISINRPGYMTKEQILDLAKRGHAIESHTWDHKNVKKYDTSDYKKQLLNPRKTIEEITGKGASYFAYPFGVWDQNAITLLKKADFKLAFILSTKRDPVSPLFTVRRMIVPSFWSTKTLVPAMKKTFSRN